MIQDLASRLRQDQILKILKKLLLYPRLLIAMNKPYKKSRSNYKSSPYLCRNGRILRSNVKNHHHLEGIWLILRLTMKVMNNYHLDQSRIWGLSSHDFKERILLAGYTKPINFFSYHNTPKHHKVLMASYHLDGEALIWFQEAEQARGFASWEVFVQALQTRFGTTTYNDPMEALTRLK